MHITEAQKILNYESKILGDMRISDVLLYIEMNPYAFNGKAKEAYKVYQNWIGGSGATPLGKY